MKRGETIECPRVWAIVPAAGHGRRIGQPKALLRLGERTFVEVVVDAVRTGGANGVVVVVNPAIEREVKRRVGDVARIVVNAKPDAEMIESIQLGLADVEGMHDPNADDGCLVTPVDKPEIGADSVRRCVDAFRATPDRIVVAARGPRRGHPIVFPWSLVGFVQSLPPSQGLNRLPRQHADRVTAVSCEDEGVILDIDTPDDHRRAQR